MRAIIFVICVALFLSPPGYGQRSDSEILQMIDKERHALSTVERDYQKGTESFFNLQLKAKEGDLRSMVELAYTHKKNNNLTKALYWFRKASNRKYGPALHALGSLYKFGEGVELDFASAYNLFTMSAEQMYPSGIYAKGYMEYKGLGCKQNYQLAYTSFLKSAKLGHGGAMYMLGLCYRNGYGAVKDKKKAMFWLQKSANKGYEPAFIELTKNKPENHVGDIELIEKTNQALQVSKNDIFPLDKFTRISGKLNQEDYQGDFEGYLVRYDWSGKHIINVYELNLDLRLEEVGLIKASWLEEGHKPVAVKAKIEENRIVFLDASMERSNHYFSSLHYDFKTMDCQIILDGHEVYLNGNITFFTPDTKEPERPIRMVLRKKLNRNMDESNIVNSLSTFPNPFKGNLKVQFRLSQKGQVQMRLYSKDGRLFYESPTNVLDVGEYLLPIKPNIPTGLYFLSVEFNGQEVQTLSVNKI